MEVFATVAEEVTDPQEATASLKTMALALGNRHAEDGTMTTTVCWTCGYDMQVTLHQGCALKYLMREF